MISETEKREALKHFMAEKAKAPVCVAFSGGVDSSLILKAAVKAATKDGSKVYAVTFDSDCIHPVIWRLQTAWQQNWAVSTK